VTRTTYRDALRAAHHEALARDPRVFVMGEDVGRYGGSYAVTKGLLQEFGEARVRDTPLSELAFVGAGVGAALGGMRPIVEVMTVNFSLLALDPIVNSAALLRHMSGGQCSVPLVIRMATGAGRQLAAQHSHSLEGWYAHVPGLRVLAPATLDDAPMLDLTVDGADELDGNLNLIKGGGGALLREKIVATSSKRMIVIADASKKVETLGAYPLPIEVVPFGLKPTVWKIDAAFKHLKMAGAMTLRLRDGKPFVTDSGNAIVDCAMKCIENPQLLSALLSGIPGIVDHGLFIGIAELAIIGTPDGVKTIERGK